MYDVVHTEDYLGYTIKVVHDDYYPYDFDDEDHVGTFAHWHRRGFFGEDFSNRQHELKEICDEVLAQAGIVVPVYLYEHSGQTINTTGFSCPWDSGQVGVWYITADEIAKAWGGDVEKARNYVTSHVKYIDCILTGEVYGYQIFKGDEEIESCWGYVGDWQDKDSYLVSTARSIIEHTIKEEMPLTHAADPNLNWVDKVAGDVISNERNGGDQVIGTDVREGDEDGKETT